MSAGARYAIARPLLLRAARVRGNQVVGGGLPLRIAGHRGGTQMLADWRTCVRELIVAAGFPPRWRYM